MIGAQVTGEKSGQAHYRQIYEPSSPLQCPAPHGPLVLPIASCAQPTCMQEKPSKSTSLFVHSCGFGLRLLSPVGRFRLLYKVRASSTQTPKKEVVALVQVGSRLYTCIAGANIYMTHLYIYIYIYVCICVCLNTITKNPHSKAPVGRSVAKIRSPWNAKRIRKHQN